MRWCSHKGVTIYDAVCRDKLFKSSVTGMMKGDTLNVRYLSTYVPPGFRLIIPFISSFRVHFSGIPTEPLPPEGAPETQPPG